MNLNTEMNDTTNTVMSASYLELTIKVGGEVNFQTLER